MTDEQKIKFFKEQSKSETGKLWKEVITDLVSGLYNSRGKQIEQVAIDQRAAEVLEREILKPLLISDQDLRPQQNREYI